MSVALVPSVHDGGFAFVDDLINKSTFAFIAVAQINFPRNATVDIETYVSLSLLCTGLIVCPFH